MDKRNTDTIYLFMLKDAFDVGLRKASPLECLIGNDKREFGIVIYDLYKPKHIRIAAGGKARYITPKDKFNITRLHLLHRAYNCIIKYIEIIRAKLSRT